LPSEFPPERGAAYGSRALVATYVGLLQEIRGLVEMVQALGGVPRVIGCK